ncbi:MAG: hypothetical protein QXJ27_00535 [Thermoplasmata archaeon]
MSQKDWKKKDAMLKTKFGEEIRAQSLEGAGIALLSMVSLSNIGSKCVDLDANYSIVMRYGIKGGDFWGRKRDLFYAPTLL